MEMLILFIAFILCVDLVYSTEMARRQKLLNYRVRRLEKRLERYSRRIDDGE